MSGNPIFSILLLPVSWIYGFIVFLRNRLYDKGILSETSFEIPVISVGNITVGGTGKTPHTEYLVRLLKEHRRIAVLSRGYRRRTKGFRLASPGDTAETIGDEPFQVWSKFPDIRVAVDADRCNGIRNILSRSAETELILLDDAFQHRSVKPGLSILLNDYNLPVTEDWLLPAGRLREPAEGRARADIIIVSKTPVNLSEEKRLSIMKSLAVRPDQRIFFSTVIPGIPEPVFRNNPVDIAAVLKSKPQALLVSGIARPDGFRRIAEQSYSVADDIRFPDHHSFTGKDIESVINHFEMITGDFKLILTTEKDAARFRKFTGIPEEIRNKMFYLPISVDFLFNERDVFNTLIFEYASKDQGGS